MRSGSLELASGRWDWTVVAQWTGSTLIFQHRHRINDEMRSWSPAAEVTESEVRELAIDAVERTWLDVDGLKWRLSVELPRQWQVAEEREKAAGELGAWLVFKRGGVRKMAALTPEQHLGELSHSELSQLLDQAHASTSHILY